MLVMLRIQSLTTDPHLLVERDWLVIVFGSCS